jgi:hypothetical protein
MGAELEGFEWWLEKAEVTNAPEKKAYGEGQDYLENTLRLSLYPKTMTGSCRSQE